MNKATAKEILKIAQKVNPEVREGEDLVTSGIYNSIEIVSLVVELESHYDIRISPMDIDVDHFNTIDAIVRLVNQCLRENTESEMSASVINIDVESYEKRKAGEEKVFAAAATTVTLAGTGSKAAADTAETADEPFDFPDDPVTVLDLLANAVSQTPDKVAVTDQYEGTLTFAELQNEAQIIGTYLAEKYGCINRPFVVIERRNVHSIAMFLGVVCSGNYYLPIDEDLPFDQMERLVAMAEPEAVLWNYNARRDEIFDLDAQLELYDEMMENEADKGLMRSVRSGFAPEDPLFGIYTSGTTGEPKCVVKSHGAMVEFIASYVSLFGFSHSDILGSKLSLMFDAFTKDLYTMLYCGAKMVIMPMGTAMPPEDAAYMEKAGVTSVVFTPSLLKNFCLLHVPENFKMPSLKRVLFVGEALQARYMNEWLKYRPDICYVNLYGTSEMTGNCLYQVVKAPVTGDVTPLTHTFPGYEVALLDETGQEVTETGAVGEICVAGDLLGIDLPENTSDRFYHTGDMVRIGEDGAWYFTSRKDTYFKHAGYRISPEQVEEAFLQVPGVDQAACLYDPEGDRILLFWTGTAAEDALASYAGENLQTYMKPSKYMQLETIPTNHNGKADRAALKAYLSE